MKNAIFGLLLAAISFVAIASPLNDKPPAAVRDEHLQSAILLARAAGGKVARVADTRSMLPVISATSLLVMQPLNGTPVSEGEIILFRKDARDVAGLDLKKATTILVCHRVVEASRGILRTKGDSLPRRDNGYVIERWVLGRVLFTVDGQTGEIRDLRASRLGERVSFTEATLRISEGFASVEARKAGVH